MLLASIYIINSLLLQTENVFQRVLQFAFSLGGDTDTIGSMAGALVGAQLGLEGVPPALLRHCEGANEVLKWGEDLFSLQQETAQERASGGGR